MTNKEQTAPTAEDDARRLQSIRNGMTTRDTWQQEDWSDFYNQDVTFLLAQLDAAEAKAKELRKALAPRVTRTGGHWNYGGPRPHFVTTGYECQLCLGTWGVGKDEQHKDGCVLAVPPPVAAPAEVMGEDVGFLPGEPDGSGPMSGSGG